MMVRVDSDALSHRELSRVFIAGTLREAQQVEELLTVSGVDYVVQVEPYRASLFFGPRYGAAFFVGAEQADYCRFHLNAKGFSRGVLEDESYQG